MKRLRSGLALMARDPSDYIDARALGIGVAESLTVPGTAGARLIAVFGYSATPVYVKYGAAPTAAVPTDLADGTASECNPTLYAVEAGKVLSFIAPAACIVTVSYYNDPAGQGLPVSV